MAVQVEFLPIHSNGEVARLTYLNGYAFNLKISRIGYTVIGH